nr:immunoglobulin light chain junction region [Macaca mulatta]
ADYCSSYAGANTYIF